MTEDQINKEREKIKSIDGNWLIQRMNEYSLNASQISKLTLLQNSTLTRLKQGLHVGYPTKSVLYYFFNRLKLENQNHEKSISD